MLVAVYGGWLNMHGKEIIITFFVAATNLTGHMARFTPIKDFAATRLQYWRDEKIPLSSNVFPSRIVQNM